MTRAIVYSSRTGNTELLAETLRQTLPDCLYFGAPSPEALKADRIYVGFWTEKGCCDSQTAVFLKTVTDQEVFLFGTAGFGVDQDYFDKVLKRSARYLRKSAKQVGSFLCQGKMPMAVRQRYEKMRGGLVKVPNLQGMIENFDRALTHPDSADLEALREAVKKADPAGSCFFVTGANCNFWGTVVCCSRELHGGGMTWLA